MNGLVGLITTYVGTEMPKLIGCRVRIIGIIGRSSSDAVRPDDRIDVKPILSDGREGFCHLDPRAVDLECLKHLKG